jgi:hypothetical protein
VWEESRHPKWVDGQMQAKMIGQVGFNTETSTT